MTVLDKAFSLFERRTNLESSMTNGRLVKREYRLNRMIALCEAFGNPQQGYEIIHVAGSKGKGSTAAYIAALMNIAGHRVGVYTSPHLTDYRERFRLEGAEFPEEEALECVDALMGRLKQAESDLTGGSPATTFELLTLLGFLLFKKIGCDTVVLECGLGGRLDATNVIPAPRAIAVTSIELEHADILGPQITDIAEEKAGIFKTGSVAWTANQPPEVLTVLRRKAAEQSMPLHELGALLSACRMRPPEEFCWELEWHNGRHEMLELSMGGPGQAENAALALELVRSLEPALSYDAPKRLKDVRLPGCFQILCRRPPIVLDGAHTPKSIKNLLKAFYSLIKKSSGEAPLLLFGCFAGKDHAAMARILCGDAHRPFGAVIVSKPGDFRPSDLPAAAKSFREFCSDVILLPSPAAAWRYALEYAGEDRGILVTGSFYMAGEIAKIAAKSMSATRGHRP